MLTGGCLCGEVRYEIDGELPPPVNCHCQYCRRAHGAAFVTVAWVPRAAFRLVSGEDEIRRYLHAGGYRAFCARCGTRLFNGLEEGGDFVSLVVSTLDGDPPRAPIMHLNLESKAGWYEILDDLPRHDALPPGVAESTRGSK